MKALPYILIFVLLLALLWMYTTTDSGHEREVLKLKKEVYYALKRADSSAIRAEKWRKTALEYGNAFRKEATRAQKAETGFIYLKEQNEILSRRIVRYSNARVDSVMVARYPD